MVVIEPLGYRGNSLLKRVVHFSSLCQVFVIIPVLENPAFADPWEEGNEPMQSQKTDLIIAIVLLQLLIEWILTPSTEKIEQNSPRSVL